MNKQHFSQNLTIYQGSYIHLSAK